MLTCAILGRIVKSELLRRKIMKSCEVLSNDVAIVGGPEWRGCVRKAGHDGPHVIQREGGAYVAYETNLLCKCKNCRGGKAHHGCEIYWEVSEKDALHLMSVVCDGLVLF